MKKLFLVFGILLSISASADRLTRDWNWSTLRLGGGIIVSPSTTESLTLSGPLYIKNLIIQAEGVTHSSTIEVMVNGQVKGTIHAPGSDPKRPLPSARWFTGQSPPRQMAYLAYKSPQSAHCLFAFQK